MKVVPIYQNSMLLCPILLLLETLIIPNLCLLENNSSSESTVYPWPDLIAEILSSICLDESKLLVIIIGISETGALLLLLKNRGPEAFWTPIASAGGTLWPSLPESSYMVSCGNSPAGSTTSYGFC
jgi:hypothetical protein